MSDLSNKSEAGAYTLPLRNLILDQARIYEAVLEAPYDGRGTEDDPFVITWIDEDLGNPSNFPKWHRWTICLLQAAITFVVALESSTFSGLSITCLSPCGFH